ncbi:MAG: DUF2934 domain-containing protein [Candidatus Solibacter usitatus]|nr:DUF2934 domain-containing protein [Candidatus Solibacter usitatus]
MPPKKKTAAETGAVTPAAVPPLKSRAAARTKSTAATHKAPARKPAARRSRPEAPGKEISAFDETLHQAEIAQEAYLLWLNRGASHGQAHQDWLRAIEIVRARHQAG